MNEDADIRTQLRDLILSMAQSGELDDVIKRVMEQEAPIQVAAAEVQRDLPEPAFATPQNFLETPKKLEIRAKPGAEGTTGQATTWQIFLPDGLNVMLRNGVSIPIDDTVVTEAYAGWWDLKDFTTTTGVWAAAVKNAGTSSTWPVIGACKIKFYGTAEAATTASGYAAAAGLFWCLASITGITVQQLVTGSLSGQMSAGDGDVASNRFGGTAPSTTYQSIDTRVDDNTTEIHGIRGTAEPFYPAEDVPEEAGESALLIRKLTSSGGLWTGLAHAVPSTTIKPRTVAGGIKWDVIAGSVSGSYIPDPVDTHTYKLLGPHPITEESASASPNDETWDYYVDGLGRATGTPQGFKTYEYVFVYNASGDAVLYRFYRIHWYDAAGRCQKVTAEQTRETADAAEPI